MFYTHHLILQALALPFRSILIIALTFFVLEYMIKKVVNFVNIKRAIKFIELEGRSTPPNCDSIKLVWNEFSVEKRKEVSYRIFAATKYTPKDKVDLYYSFVNGKSRYMDFEKKAAWLTLARLSYNTLYENAPVSTHKKRNNKKIELPSSIKQLLNWGAAFYIFEKRSLSF